MRRSLPLFIALLALPMLGSLACSAAPPPSAEAPPPFLTDSMSKLFDNSIEPSAVGLGVPMRADARNLLLQRAQNAEFILHARIATVSTEGTGETARYIITLRASGAPLNGVKPPADTFTISVAATDPSYALARSRDLQLVGTDVVAIMRRFTTQEGPVLRWYLAPNTEQVADIVKQAMLLSTVSGAQGASGSPRPAR